MGIKPCPFCGTPDPEIGGNFVQCRQCGGQAFVEEVETETEAKKRWNMRAALPPFEQEDVNRALDAAATALEASAATIRARAK